MQKKFTRRNLMKYSSAGVFGTGLLASTTKPSQAASSIEIEMPTEKIVGRKSLDIDGSISYDADDITDGLVDHDIQEGGWGSSRADLGWDWEHAVFSSAELGSSSQTVLTSWFDFDIPSSGVDTLTVDIDLEYQTELMTVGVGINEEDKKETKGKNSDSPEDADIEKVDTRPRYEDDEATVESAYAYIPLTDILSLDTSTAYSEAAARLYNVPGGNQDPGKTDGHVEFMQHSLSGFLESETYDSDMTLELSVDNPSFETYRLVIPVLAYCDTGIGVSFATSDIRGGGNQFTIDEVTIEAHD